MAEDSTDPTVALLAARIDRMEGIQAELRARIDRMDAEINELFTRLQGSYKGKGATFGPGAPIRPTPPGPATPPKTEIDYDSLVNNPSPTPREIAEPGEP